MAVNSVAISGRIGGEPELRRTQSGTAVLSFSVAVNERRKNQQTGEWEDRANWVDVSMFGNRAESLSNYLCKGTMVQLQGLLRQSKWQAKDGTSRSRLDVIAEELEFMTPRDGDRRGSRGEARQDGAEYVEASVYDENIPF